MNQFGRYGSRNSTPEGVLHLLIINILFFVVTYRFSDFMYEYFNGYYLEASRFKPWQVITHMFMHADITHIFFNMFGLWMFGRILANMWGTKRFLFFYFTCGLGAFLAQEAFMAVQVHVLDDPDAAYGSFLGASGAVYGVLVGFAYLFPNTRLMLLFPPIPIKAKYLVSILILMDVFFGFTRFSIGNTAHFAHLGGALCGFLLVKYWQKDKTRFY